MWEHPIMTIDVAAKRAAFRELHREGFFILPNPWDAGSAVRLAARGFKALASTSAGFAWTLGRDDGGGHTTTNCSRIFAR